uniref:synaptosomal-associated protein 47-like n=1 Tax=Nyctereutes procyonoides TaxID=34880 RepID=UPI00244511C3|nr:synaptosomal-associated protein 47-like [Nyctereutes procyonoides]
MSVSSQANFTVKNGTKSHLLWVRGHSELQTGMKGGAIMQVEEKVLATVSGGSMRKPSDIGHLSCMVIGHLNQAPPRACLTGQGMAWERDTGNRYHGYSEGKCLSDTAGVNPELNTGKLLLTELESPSWWPFSSKLWKMPAETNPKESTSMASPKVLGKEGVVVRIPAVISQGNASHVKAGSLTILVSGLEIHDSCSLLMHRFEREDIDDIKVHTPYEISIRQRFIGRPDIAYRLISAKMSEAIPILEVQFSKKMELFEDALMPRSARSSSPIEKGCSVWQAASGLMDRAMPHEPCSGSQEGPSLQLQRSEPLISEGDAQELRQVMCTPGTTWSLHVTCFFFCLPLAPRWEMLACLLQGPVTVPPSSVCSCSWRKERAVPILSPCVPWHTDTPCARPPCWLLCLLYMYTCKYTCGLCVCRICRFMWAFCAYTCVHMCGTCTRVYVCVLWVWCPVL